MSEYFDYRYRFPVAGIALAVDAIVDITETGSSLRANNLLGEGTLKDMLGGPLGRDGTPVPEGEEAFRGTESDGYVYLHTRATVDPKDLGIDISVFGLEPVDEETSSAVLGVWA